MTKHLTDVDLILHFYGDADAAEQQRIDEHLASCPDCRHANATLRDVMTMVDGAAPVDAPPGFERVVWARLEPHLPEYRPFAWWARPAYWLPRVALGGGVAGLVIAAFLAGRITSTPPSHDSPLVAQVEPGRVLDTEVGAHLERTQMMLVELANAETTHAGVLADEQPRAADLVAANRVIRASAQQAGDAQAVDILEDLERVLLEIANAPANASSNDLSDLQSRIAKEDLLFRLRVIDSEMRQQTQDRSTGDRTRPRQPIS